MKKIIPSLLYPLFFITAHAQAEEKCTVKGNFYAEALGGANFLQNTTINGNKTTYETGYVVGGLLGYNWNHYRLRFEAEYAFRRNAISRVHFVTEGSSHHGHFQTSSYMGNLLWDWPVSFWHIRPFIGAGIGYDFQQMHSSNSRIVFSQQWHHFSWQLMAGLSYPILRTLDISLQYQFHQGGSHFNNNSLIAGLTYKFGFLKRCPKKTKTPA